MASWCLRASVGRASSAEGSIRLAQVCVRMSSVRQKRLGMRTLPSVTLVVEVDGASDATRVMVGGVLAVNTGEPRDELVAEASQDINPPAAVVVAVVVVVRVLATEGGRGDDGNAG